MKVLIPYRILLILRIMEAIYSILERLDGWMVDSPYNTLQQNIDGTDLLVNFCRQAGIYYTIAVRSGPGAYDTYIESNDQTIESRIWDASDSSERILYGNMLKDIVAKYSGDSLFVGIVLGC